MKESKLIPILEHFLNITILKIDSDGKILEIVINTKEEFEIERGENISTIFTKEDKIRIERLLRLGVNSKRRYMEISPKLGMKEYVHVEIYLDGEEIYTSLEFLKSKKQVEIETEKKMEQMSMIAERDPLTGLLNRYGYWERTKQLLLCGDSERKLGILVIDMDNLRDINNTKGHNAGDKAINQIADLIASTVRSRDIAVRYGGDEFLVIVEELSGKKSAAKGLAERLVNTINKNKDDYLTSISVGVHLVKVGDFEKCIKGENVDRKCWDKAVEVADKMVYKAKNSGRARVVCSTD
jgi:diguanylate cyclase (GGDEF)-like protein